MLQPFEAFFENHETEIVAYRLSEAIIPVRERLG